jgi:hypothetical protein
LPGELAADPGRGACDQRATSVNFHPLMIAQRFNAGKAFTKSR